MYRQLGMVTIIRRYNLKTSFSIVSRNNQTTDMQELFTEKCKALMRLYRKSKYPMLKYPMC